MGVLGWVWKRATFSTLLLLVGLAYCVHVSHVMYRVVYPPRAVYSAEKHDNLLRLALVEGDELDMEVRVSPSRQARGAMSEPPVWKTTITYGRDHPALTKHINVTLNTRPHNPNTRPNLFVWATFTKRGFSPNPGDGARFVRSFTSTQPFAYGLVEFMVPRQERSLLSEEEEVHSGEVPHYKRKAVVRLVHEEAQFPRNGLSPFAPVEIDPHTSRLVPISMVDEMWITRDDFIPLHKEWEESLQGSGTVTFPLELEYQPIGAEIFRLHSFIQHAISKQTALLQNSEQDLEEIRLMFVENSPLVLLVTVVVSVFHLIFEFLSLKNDITFWRAQKSLEGVSLRSLALQSVSKLVILLYIREQGTNVLVQLGLLFDFVVSVWKVVTAVSVGVSPRFPFVRVATKSTYQGFTGEHDAYALRQLSKILCPLMLGYLVYSLVYERHHGWYSFLIGWLASCVYGFGFILMTPQLFLNYKLKSVAHLPWRAMVYRFINTFIDDLFAFVIRMPTMHRVSVLRDDIVFVIYLYQRWIYPTDEARRCDMDESGADQQQQQHQHQHAEGKEKTQ